MHSSFQSFVLNLLRDLVQNDPELIILMVIGVCAIIVMDSVHAYKSLKRRQTGVSKKFTPVGVDGSKFIPQKNYVSEIQGLAGRPDAVVIEHGHFIPVERKPMSNKIRDRYIAQLLVYMRLIEEFEGKKPPYGYLILGPKARRVRIDNTEEKQVWLSQMVLEMRAILKGESSPIPQPQKQKCDRCPARNACEYGKKIRFPGQKG